MLPRKIRQGRRTKSDRGAILHKVAREEFSKKYHSSRDLNEVRKHWGREGKQAIIEAASSGSEKNFVEKLPSEE